MYAIASVSSSAYQMAQVTNEVESQAANLAVPAPSRYNQQGEQASSIAASAAVQAPSPSLPTFSIAAKASQATPVHSVSNSSTTQRQKFSAPQQQQINQFNLEMLTQSPQNVSARPQAPATTQNMNVQSVQKPAATSSILTDSPYLIVVLNQNLVNMQKTESPPKAKPPDKTPI